MFKSILLYSAFFLFALSAQAQTATVPFIKIAHLGAEGRPIIDLYLTTQEPTASAEQGLDGRYIFQSVCLLTPPEFTALRQYIEGYSTSHKPDSKDTKYGTFEITLGLGQAAQPLVYARSQSVALLQGATKVLQKQSPGPDKSEAVRRLEATTRRLLAPAK